MQSGIRHFPQDPCATHAKKTRTALPRNFFPLSLSLSPHRLSLILSLLILTLSRSHSRISVLNHQTFVPPLFVYSVDDSKIRSAIQRLPAAGLPGAAGLPARRPPRGPEPRAREALRGAEGQRLTARLRGGLRGQQCIPHCIVPCQAFGGLK